jgi:ketosteroid isomerase-like protein
MTTTTSSIPEHIIALERAALERWGQGDPQGFVEIMAPHETYFDPATATRLDGVSAVRGHFAPFIGRIRIERFTMLDPHVLHLGDAAVLTFNILNEGAQLDDGPKRTLRWNVTEVFQKTEDGWKIVHSHFSYVQPQLAGGVGGV